MRFLTSIALLSGIILAIAILVHWGWKGVVLWDSFMSRQVKRSGRPFQWRPRYKEDIGLLFEYLFFIVLRKRSYFHSYWWLLRASAILALPVFIAIIFMNDRVEDYYTYLMNGEVAWAFFKGGFAFWWLNIVHLLYLVLFVALVVESVRMHQWAAPARVLFCSILMVWSGVLSLLCITLIVMTGLFYLIFMWIRNLIIGPAVPVDHSHYVIRSWNPVVTDFRQFAFEWYYQDDFNSYEVAAVEEVEEVTELRKKPERDTSLPQFHPD